MPRFSEDDVVDFLVAEAVVRAGQEAQREARKEAEDDAKNQEKINEHREWAESTGALSDGGLR